MWRALQQYGVHGSRSGLYQDSKAVVRGGDEVMDWFEVERGRCKTGVPNVTMAFNIYLDMVMKEALPLSKGEHA